MLPCSKDPFPPLWFWVASQCLQIAIFTFFLMSGHGAPVLFSYYRCSPVYECGYLPANQSEVEDVSTCFIHLLYTPSEHHSLAAQHSVESVLFPLECSGATHQPYSRWPGRSRFKMWSTFSIESALLSCQDKAGKLVSDCYIKTTCKSSGNLSYLVLNS